jgi:hypothetical protein
LNPFKEKKALQFLGSTRLALPMLLLLAVLLAVGTAVESRYSAAVAGRFVYGTWWFAGFLFLLAVNLLCSALSRLPWKKHQTGFILTHLGIICVLAGSLVTRQLGVDGQIALNEGEEGRSFLEDKPILSYRSGDNPVLKIPAAFSFRPPNAEHPLLAHLPDGGVLMVDQYYLNARKKTGPEGTYEPMPLASREGLVPALHYELIQHPDKREGWLGYPDRVSFAFPKGPAITLAYGPKEGELPFILRLVKFKIGFNPGTEKPASYSSDVDCVDPEKGTRTSCTISMNQPLDRKSVV